MSPSAAKTLVLRYVEAFNRGDMEALRELFTPDAIIQGVLGGGPIETALPIWQELHDCLGVNLEVEAMVEEGDAVAVRFIDRGTSRRAFRGQGPTGKSYEVVAMEWFVLKDGLIHRRWGARDTGAQWRQMGLDTNH